MPLEVVDHLSVSSMNTLGMCSEKWRRRYIELEYEPSNGPMVIGKAAGAAECASDHTWMETDAPLDTEAVLDSYSDEFDLAATEDVDWKGEKVPALKDSGAAALKAYHSTLIPETAKPIAAERKAEVDVDGVEFVAYLDLELVDGTVIDRKVTKSKWSQAKADDDIQATGYLAVRRAEAESQGADPATGFAFDTMVRTKTPSVARIPTTRTDDEIDTFLSRILQAAEEIEWRVDADNWAYAPNGAWWCSESFCGYWSSCPGGGLSRQNAARAVTAG